GELAAAGAVEDSRLGLRLWQAARSRHEVGEPAMLGDARRRPQGRPGRAGGGARVELSAPHDGPSFRASDAHSAKPPTVRTLPIFWYSRWVACSRCGMVTTPPSAAARNAAARAM